MMVIFFVPPLETLSNILILNAGFQRREGQRLETESTFVYFVQLVHREERRGKRGKKYPFVNLANCTGKTER